MTDFLSSITRAVCYLRKSREDEEAERRGEDTLAKQREMMMRDVLVRYSIPYDLAEEVASGDNIKQRPVFQSILPKLGHTYQAIFCKDLSRLGRGSYADMGIVYDIIRDRCVYIITKDAVYNPSNFSDLRMIRFSLFFNREEYEMTLWRLTEGKYEGARRGKWVAGSVPYGYRYDARSQTLEPDPEQSAVVRMVYRLYVRDRLGYRSIAQNLTDLGYPSPRGHGVWHPEVVRRMLQNPAYIGTLQFRTTKRAKADGRRLLRPSDEHIVVEQAFPALVDHELWTEVQSQLGQRTNHPRVKAHHSPSELAGLVVCAVCRKRFVKHESTQRYRRHSQRTSTYHKEYLYCTTCRYSVQYRSCEGQILRALDRAYPIDWSLVHRLFADAKRKGELVTRRVGPDDVGPCDLKAEIQRLLDERHKAGEKLARARGFLLDGTLGRDDFLAAKQIFVHTWERVDGQVARLRRLLAESHSESSILGHGADDFLVELCAREQFTLSDLYKSLTHRKRKNDLLRSLIGRVTLHRTHKSHGKGDPTRFDLTVELKL